MKLEKIAYWVTTLLVCVLIGFSGINDLIQAPFIMDAMKHLGYPSYIVPFLGVGKIIAILILLFPKKMIIKHWAYAGVVIDLLGASYSHLMSKDDMSNVITPLIGIGLALTSYFLYLKNK